MEFTIAGIDKIVAGLSRLMPAKPNKESARKCSMKDAILMMAPKLFEMKEMGFTTKELVKALADHGIVIKAATLNRYLCEQQGGSQEAGSGLKPKRAARKKRKNGEAAKTDADTDKPDAKPDNEDKRLIQPSTESTPDKLAFDNNQSADDYESSLYESVMEQVNG